MENNELKFSKTYGIVAMIQCAVLLVSNICAVKLLNFFGTGWAVDGGVILFPVSYVIGDVAVELFGKKNANKLIYASFAMNIVTTLVFLLVGFLPAHPEWTEQAAWDTILGFTPRIVAGSLIGYLASNLTNNDVFVKIRKKTGERKLFIRSLGSSLVGRLVDNILFETIAFLGVLSFKEFLKQAILAYILGMFFEVCLTPVTYGAVKLFKKVENIN